MPRLERTQGRIGPILRFDWQIFVQLKATLPVYLRAFFDVESILVRNSVAISARNLDNTRPN